MTVPTWKSKRAAASTLPLIVALFLPFGSRLSNAWAATNSGVRTFSWGASGISSPTAEKPQSKLWFNDGIWWGSLFNTATEEYRIYRFNKANNTWSDTGTVVDARNSSHADTLWDGRKLYVASAGSVATASGDSAYIRRFSYDVSTKRYRLDAGFPVRISSTGMEAIVLTKDSTGQLWVTYTQNGKVFVNRSLSNHQTWGTPFVPPVSGTSVHADDISTVVSFAGQIGVMWSNQIDAAFYFTTHRDQDPDNVWQPKQTIVRGSGLADDHINLKVLRQSSGDRLFAVVKTARNEGSNPDPSAPLTMLLVRHPDGVWRSYIAGRVRDDHTRPIVLLDVPNRQLYIFATTSTGGGTLLSGTASSAIFYKQTSLDQIAFVEGKGTPFIQTETDTQINNATSTKQNLTGEMGVMVLAADQQTRYYLHNTRELAVPQTGAYKSEVLADKPVSYWRLGEASGTSFADSTGQSHGTLAGGFTLGVPGAIRDGSNTAMSFNGSTGYGAVPNTAALNPTGDLTVEAWAKPNALDGMTRTVVHKGAGADSDTWQYRITLHSTSQWRACVYAGTSEQCILAPNAPSTTSWTHLALTRNGTAVSFYINGAVVGTASLSGSLNVTSGALAIGRAGHSADYFNGSVDEVAIYATGLSPARIAAHYQYRVAAGANDTEATIYLPMVLTD